MKFNPKKISFGRHETFPLRYSWLTKAYQEISANPEAFEADNATVRLGVGKNMVNAIRYWSQATQIIEKAEKGYKPTTLGDFIFNEEEGVDPYLEDEATIWLLHWSMATNSEQATCIYWLFNRYHKPEFTTEQALDALMEFAKENVSTKPSKNTLKNDVAVTLRMYADARPKAKQSVDEFLDTPFASIKLLSLLADSKTYKVQVGEHDNIPLEIIAYAVFSLFDLRGKKEISIEELMYGGDEYPALGAVFCLTENAFLSKLEQLKQQRDSQFGFSETAGIKQLYLTSDHSVDPMDYLRSYYTRSNYTGAAT